MGHPPKIIWIRTSNQTTQNIEKIIRKHYDAISDFQNPVEEHVRDVFVVGCFTAMRFSDYSTLDGSAIRDNRYEFVQKKTGDKVTVPIHPVVKQILEKYNYSLPEVPPNNEFNRIIKIISFFIRFNT